MSSSYYKGIDNLLKKDAKKFEQIVREYILSVNSRFYSTEFPSTQIAKVVIDKLDMKRSKFAIIHKIIRLILERWNESGLCDMVRDQSVSRRVKAVYRFTPDGLNEMKMIFIEGCIDSLKNEKVDFSADKILKNRDKIIGDLLLDFSDV